jgi:hypothetical protein
MKPSPSPSAPMQPQHVTAAWQKSQGAKVLGDAVRGFDRVVAPELSTSDRVARALRDAVDDGGAPIVRMLYAYYCAFNALFFLNALPDCTILLSPPSSPRALGDHCATDEHGLKYRVRIAPSLARRGELWIADVLLHELVHVACAKAGEDEPGYKGHGPKFAARCNAIGAIIGLAPVGVLGRGGLPNCAQWPTNVRPAGYYGENDKRGEQKAPKEPKAPAGDAGDVEGEKRSALEIALEAIARCTLEDCSELADAIRVRARTLEIDSAPTDEEMKAIGAPVIVYSSKKARGVRS